MLMRPPAGPSLVVAKCAVLLAFESLPQLHAFSSSFFKPRTFSRKFSKLTESPGAATSPVAVLPYFRITDWAGAEPIMRQFVELAAQDPGCTHYGWTGDGSGRVAWNSHVSKTDEALVDYLDRVKPLVSAMAGGPATLERFDFHAPVKDIERQRQTLKGPVTSFLVEESFFSRLPHTTPQMILLNSRYKINSWSETKDVMDALFEAVQAEDGCLSFGWHKEGNVIASRAAFRDSAAVLAHLEHTSAIAERLSPGPAQHVHLEVHGPRDELRALREGEALKAMKPEYFEEHVFVDSNGDLKK